MPKDPRKTWEYFAKAVIQEEDPEKVSSLMQQLYDALAEDEEQTNPKLPRSKNTPSERETFGSSGW